MKIVRSSILACVLAVAPVTAQAQGQASIEAELARPRPIAALNSIWIEELTWMEVRDALKAGKRTAIVPTGGVEQNGPYVATGKHNYVLQGVCEAIARELGDALCAPIVKFVPEGSIDPPSGHMRYPGTITVRAETFQMMLEDIGASLKAHGFEHIVYIGDSGGNQTGMAAAATSLNARWGVEAAHFIPEFYDNAGLEAYMNAELGIVEVSEGFHDFFWLTAMQMLIDPETVRYEQRVAAGLDHINGVPLTPIDQTLAVGRKLVQWRVDGTTRAIRAAIAGSR